MVDLAVILRSPYVQSYRDFPTRALTNKSPCRTNSPNAARAALGEEQRQGFS